MISWWVHKRRVSLVSPARGVTIIQTLSAFLRCTQRRKFPVVVVCLFWSYKDQGRPFQKAFDLRGLVFQLMLCFSGAFWLPGKSTFTNVYCTTLATLRNNGKRFTRNIYDLNDRPFFSPYTYLVLPAAFKKPWFHWHLENRNPLQQIVELLIQKFSTRSF